MIDLHCHLLPGIDDGPADVAGAIAEARAHVAAGVTTVVCTPHVNHQYRTDAAMIQQATAAFAGELEAAGVPLTIAAGAEVSLARAMELDDAELAELHLGDGPFLLLEAPLGSDMPRMAQLVLGLQARGHRILLAHPERCAAFHQDPALLGQLVEAGALAQVTAASLQGQFGRTVQKLAKSMLDQELIHVVASDAHDAIARPPGLRASLVELQLEPLVDWATRAVPEAVLAGAEIPARPAVGPPRRRGLFRR